MSGSAQQPFVSAYGFRIIGLGAKHSVASSNAVEHIHKVPKSDQSKKPERQEIDTELHAHIKMMVRENSMWSAPRIQGEFLMLGFKFADSTDAKYVPGRRGPTNRQSRHSRKTFLANHREYISATYFLTVPPLEFTQLYAKIFIDHQTRVWRHVATNASITEASIIKFLSCQKLIYQRCLENNHSNITFRLENSYLEGLLTNLFKFGMLRSTKDDHGEGI